MAAWSDDLPLLLILVGLVAFVAFSVARLRRKARRRGGAQREVGPVAIPPEEIELTEGPIFACMRCGSTRVRLANLREGGIPGAGDMLGSICARCGNRGPALEFADPTAYRAFVKGLHDEPKP